MDAWHVAHLVVLSAWAGVVLVEAVIEQLGEARDMEAAAIRAHFWIDVLVELPLIAAVLTTGAVLLMRGWPPPPAHLVKLGCAFAAVAINLYCALVVIVRYRTRGDLETARRHSRRVRLSALGVPFGVLAAYLGFSYAL
jgi:hypothetical protein